MYREESKKNEIAVFLERKLQIPAKNQLVCDEEGKYISPSMKLGDCPEVLRDNFLVLNLIS